MSTPLPVLPLTTLPAPAAEPPMTASKAVDATSTPSPEFGSALVPPAATPIKFPSTVLS